MAKKSVVIRADIKDLELATADDLVKSEQLNNLVRWSTVASITASLKNKKQFATLFQIGTTEYYLEMHRDQWISALQSIMEFKMQQDTKDSYEECAKLRDLIAEIKESEDGKKPI